MVIGKVGGWVRRIVCGCVVGCKDRRRGVRCVVNVDCSSDFVVLFMGLFGEMCLMG